MLALKDKSVGVRATTFEATLELAMGAPFAMTLLVRDSHPLGDVTLVPKALTGRSEADMAHAMAAAVSDTEFVSAADALKHLRQAFPQAPLRTRVAATNVLMERLRRAFES